MLVSICKVYFLFAYKQGLECNGSFTVLKGTPTHRFCAIPFTCIYLFWPHVQVTELLKNAPEFLK